LSIATSVKPQIVEFESAALQPKLHCQLRTSDNRPTGGLAMNTMKMILGVSGHRANQHVRGMKVPNPKLKKPIEQIRKLHDASLPHWSMAANSTFGDRPVFGSESRQDETSAQHWNIVERWVRRFVWLVVVAATIVDLGVTFAPAGVTFL
jgi:hypothetical protein